MKPTIEIILQHLAPNVPQQHLSIQPPIDMLDLFINRFIISFVIIKYYIK